MKLKSGHGFTIVELLIVIVVVALLAAIALVSYSGVRNRADDTAIQADLRTIGESFGLFYTDNSAYPVATSDLTGLKLRASKSSYNMSIPGQSGDIINLIYCYSPATAPTSFALVSISKSGKVYEFYNGSVSAYPGTITVVNSSTVCSAAGVPIGSGGRTFLYDNGWSSTIGG